MTAGASKEIRNILVIHVSRIGDTLLATPAIRAIATAYPNAKLTCLAHPKRKEILEGLPFIHQLGSITKKRAPFLGWLSRKNYDLAIVFGFDKPLVAYALRIAQRVVAFEQGADHLDKRLFKSVTEPPFQSCHAVEYLLRLPETIGIPQAGLHLSYQVSAMEKQWARQELSTLRANHATPLIGLQIASFPTKGYRDWPIEHFITLCQRIKTEHPNTHFLIFGGALEQNRTHALHHALENCSSLYAGRLTLRQTGALMNEIDLYIGVDTGPTHIMGALHRPMVAMYHGYSPSRLLAPLDHPCLYTIDHPLADRCSPEARMSDITIDRAWETVQKALTEHLPQ